MNHLIIGNKNYSSWSLRPWLLLKEKGISFRETKVLLGTDTTKAELFQFSSSGKVPVFEHDDNTVWDSLSICEYIADLYPDLNCWPRDLQDRSLARSISHEMHSSFFAIRNTFPMNCRLSMDYDKITVDLQTEIDRVCEIWRTCRSKYSAKGGFLLGDFTIADAMYAPLVLRFQSYGIQVGSIEREYMDTILAMPSLNEWITEGVAETATMPSNEVAR